MNKTNIYNYFVLRNYSQSWPNSISRLLNTILKVRAMFKYFSCIISSSWFVCSTKIVCFFFNSWGTLSNLHLFSQRLVKITATTTEARKNRGLYLIHHLVTQVNHLVDVLLKEIIILQTSINTYIMSHGDSCSPFLDYDY